MKALLMKKVKSLAGQFYPKMKAFLTGLMICSGFSCSNACAEVADTLVNIKPSVVGIGSYQPLRSPRGQLKGTGFVVADGRHVVTCHHIVKPVLDIEKNETWAVFLGQGRNIQYRPARKVAIDEDNDLVLLKIEGDPLPPLRIARQVTAREGDQLYFTGYPIGSVLGLNASTHRAGLAAIVPIFTPLGQAGRLNARTIRQAANPYQIYQLDAIAYPGNSGSPLWNPQTGEVMGVVNSVFIKGSKETVLTDPSGISYAIPAGYVSELLKQAGLSQ
jgi:S1-C subfamily serine protease